MTGKLLLVTPKFSLPTLTIYLASPLVILSVCSGHAYGMASTWLLLHVELGAHWECGGTWFISQLCSILLGKVTSVFLHDVKCCG